MRVRSWHAAGTACSAWGEAQGPLAAVVIGGIFANTLLTFLVLPGRATEAADEHLRDGCGQALEASAL